MLENAALSAASIDPPLELAEGPRIVIAEDEPTVRLILASVLTAEGYQVAEAANGIEALERAREIRPALIILDVEMPGANGFEVCRAIRGESLLDGPPVLILTGLEQEAALRRAFEAGATDFANKPITPALLLHRVRFLLRNEAAVAQLRTSELSLEKAQRIARLGSWSWHLPSGLTSYSRPARALLGLSQDEGHWIKEYLDRIPAAERRAVEDAFESAKQGGSAVDVEHQIRFPDGTLRSAHTRAEIERDAAGRPAFLHGTTQDVTRAG
jgi:DNA-binding response OmpR family regulator